MTAINAYSTDNGAYLMTDTAIYNQAGNVLGWRSKVTPFSRLGLAIASSGKVIDGDRLDAALWKVGNYDEALRELPQMLEDVADDFDDPERALDVFVAGWSQERRCGEVYRISTRDIYDDPAFTLKKHRLVSSTEIPRSALSKVGGAFASDGRMVTNDPERLLTSLIQAQRITPWTHDGAFCVGGGAEMTVINASGIQQRVVLQWPDVIGWKIEPDQSPADVGTEQSAKVEHIGLSRLQRERAIKRSAKLERKAAV